MHASIISIRWLLLILLDNDIFTLLIILLRFNSTNCFIQLNNINNNKTKIVNELLISTLSLEMSNLHENIFIKSCFTNSRI